jgi:HemY protein
MRLVLVILLILIGTSILTSTALEKPGFVLIAYDQISIEIALFDFVLAGVVVFLLAYMFMRFMSGLILMPGALRRSYRQHRKEKARQLFYKGLLEFSEGRWARSERLLLRSVWHHDTPLLGYLVAARAAQMQSAYERRDAHLKNAIESDPNADVAVGLLQAELQMSREQNEQALATLRHLREISPHHDYVLYLSARLHRELGDWSALGEMLPDLRKSRSFPSELLDELEARVSAELMRQAAQEQNVEGLRVYWKKIPRAMKQNARVLNAYTDALDQLGLHEQASGVMRRSLDHHWDTSMVEQLGDIRHPKPLDMLSHAEKWLKDHGQDPVLLLTLGKLAIQAELWGKARVYVESAIRHGPSPEAYARLAQLLEQMGEQAKAQAAYRDGLSGLITQESTPALSAPRTSVVN